MKIIKNIQDMKAESLKLRVQGFSIGFVPTMGYLHEGHLSLVKESIKMTDRTVASLFVNPTQFAPHEDFDQYPRDFQRDFLLLEKEGVDIVFFPDTIDIYPDDYKTFVEVQGIQEKLCGVSRPHFFRGVCTIVLNLFNIIRPDFAFFGQKDAQQSVILKKMVKDLKMDVRIEVLPIVRDSDGLALSSRNAYLTENQREAALSLSRSLKEVHRMVDSGERSTKKIIKRIRSKIEPFSEAEIDYISIVDVDNLEPIEEIRGHVLVALAVFIGKTRLIDNSILSVDLTP
ncbi:pantoate--beta-alanine ligase [Acidobacteriota bacterium]